MARGKSRGKDRHGPDRLEEGADGGSWLTTYADAITLLMAFFMMLYAMSQVDVVKFESLVAGFAVPFGNDSFGQSSGRDSILESGQGIVSDAAAVPRATSQDNPFNDLQNNDPVDVTVPQLDQVDSEARGGGGTDEDGLPLIGFEELRAVRDAIAEAMSVRGLNDEITYSLDVRGLVVSIATDDILFATGSAQLAPDAQEILGALAPVLAQFGNRITIEGHTDDTPLNRPGYTNWNLSTDRAVTVVQTLIDDFGLRPTRLSAEGFGEHQPVASNDSAEGRAKNRRVEVVILAGGNT